MLTNVESPIVPLIAIQKGPLPVRGAGGVYVRCASAIESITVGSPGLTARYALYVESASSAVANLASVRSIAAVSMGDNAASRPATSSKMLAHETRNVDSFGIMRMTSKRRERVAEEKT